MKIAVCFLSCKRDHFNLEKWKFQAYNSKYHNIDIYEYIDHDAEYIIDGNTILFNYDYLRNKFNWHVVYNNLGSAVGMKSSTLLLPWLDMWSNHKNEYDMYLYIENDIAYFGKKNFFDEIDFNCDTIFATNRYLMSQFNWGWYDSEHKLDRNVIKDYWHGLCNFFGYTSNKIEKLAAFINEGNYAHCEWLLSSFAMNQNPLHVHYVSNYMNVWTSYIKRDLPQNKVYDLIHPIKTEYEYNSQYYK